jgi:hypothetical protein
METEKISLNKCMRNQLSRSTPVTGASTNCYTVKHRSPLFLVRSDFVKASSLAFPRSFPSLRSGTFVKFASLLYLGAKKMPRICGATFDLRRVRDSNS